MSSWKSSTLLVVGAFAVSVLLLFLKSGMVSERRASGPARVSNEIYSPAAADPELRSRERAEGVRRAALPRARAVNEQTTASPQRGSVAAAGVGAAGGTPVFPTHDVPAGHVYYVVTATFRDPERARLGLADMRRRGLSEAFIGTFDEGKYYSVIGDTYAREEQARLLVAELKEKHGIGAYVYHKRD